MIHRLIAIFALASAPLLASAGPFKCTGSDGKVSFQDQPCQQGATGGQITIKTTPPDPDAIAAAKRTSARAAQSRQGDNEAKANRDQVDAHNRSVRCNNARRSLGVLKEQRPVFRYDNKGERQYVDDAARQSEIAAAERGVAENCN